MVENKQMQKAGNNATQIQVEKIEYNNGVSLETVTQIVKNEITIALKENSLVAEDKARSRLTEFSNIFLPQLIKSNLLECFSEPAIQFFFRNVEKTAMCTDSKHCYKMLSEILVHRANKKDDFTIVAATNKAIEVADKISDDALLFLTVFLCIDGFIPNSGDIKQGLKTLDDLYENILRGKQIPFNQKIIDNLEIVDAIRRQNFLSHKKFDEFFPNLLEGYSSAGIDKYSENYQKLKDLLKEIGIKENDIFSEALVENHIRINVVNRAKLVDMLISNQQDKVNNLLNQMYDLYDKSPEKMEMANKKFCSIVQEYPNLQKVKNWWDNNMIDCGINITPIGKVLAHTNAKCLDNNIPDLN